MLLDAGADPNHGTGEDNVMQRLIGNFVWSLSDKPWSSYPDTAIKCLELAVANGGRWRPDDDSLFECFRKAIWKRERNSMVRYLNQMVKAGVIEQDVFKRLMDTPQMKAFLDSKIMWMVPLRRFAGYILDSRGRRLATP